jgi:hypothetical protein
MTTGRIEFVILRTSRSVSDGLHLPLRERSFVQLQVAESPWQGLAPCRFDPLENALGRCLGHRQSGQANRDTRPITRGDPVSQCRRHWATAAAHAYFAYFRSPKQNIRRFVYFKPIGKRVSYASQQRHPRERSVPHRHPPFEPPCGGSRTPPSPGSHECVRPAASPPEPSSTWRCSLRGPSSRPPARSRMRAASPAYPRRRSPSPTARAACSGRCSGR